MQSSLCHGLENRGYGKTYGDRHLSSPLESQCRCGIGSQPEPLSRTVKCSSLSNSNHWVLLERATVEETGPPAKRIAPSGVGVGIQPLRTGYLSWSLGE